MSTSTRLLGSHGWYRRILPAFLLFALLTNPGGFAPRVALAQAQTLTFAPAADAYVDAARPDTNLGSITILRTYASPEQRSYLRFAVTGLAGRPVTRATLRLYANGSSTAGYQVAAVDNSSWSETGITYNNKPALGAVIGSQGEHSGAAYTEVDVTPLIVGDGTYSLAITTTSTKAVSYPSREAANNRPALVVDLAASTASPSPVSTRTATAIASATTTPPLVGTATAFATPTSSASLTTPANTSAPPATPTAQSGITLTNLPVADAYADAARPSTNLGTSSILRTLASPAQRSYLRFNVSGLAGRAVTRARLRLYANGSSAAGYTVHAVSSNAWSEMGITYANMPAVGPVLGSITAHGIGYTEVIVTGYIQADGTYSFALLTTSTKAISYPSREAASNRPQLVLDLSSAVGAIATAMTATPTRTPAATRTQTPANPTPNATRTLTPSPGPSPLPGVDRSDALLLYRGSQTTSDSGFERVVRYYGLRLARLDLATTPVTDARLRDEAGAYYPTIFIDGANLDAGLDTTERLVLGNAMAAGGANVLVTSFRLNNSLALQALTQNEIRGSADVADTAKDYIISQVAPELTRELTGLTVTYPADALDFALTLDTSPAHTTVIVQGTDSGGRRYPIFVRYRAGMGGLYVVSNFADSTLQNAPLRDNYQASGSGTAYRQRWFSQIMPLMMFVRYTAGAEAWHRSRDFANFTLDDPALRPSAFNYAGILNEAQDHHFHFTLAMPPVQASNREAAVVDLFRNNPAYLSLSMHGNNHDGYEFYKYAAVAGDPYASRPYADQVADIVQGLSRLDSFRQQTRLSHARAMVFPYNISPSQTLIYLKSQNFQATLNSSNVPLDKTRANAWDSEMYPAEMSYANFPVILRYHAQAAPYPFDLFLDRPVWLYEHKDVFAASGITWLSPLADAVNNLNGTVEWHSIEYILEHMYLEKDADDGSAEVMVFGSQVMVSNDLAWSRLYHVRREENLNVPLVGVTVDGVAVPYRVANGRLEVDVLISPGGSRAIKILYANP